MSTTDNYVNWDQVEDAFYENYTLADGTYEGVTKSYSIFMSKKDKTPMFSLKVSVDSEGGNYEVSYVTKFNFYNKHLEKLLEVFNIELILGQRPNLDELCNVPVEVEVKTNGEFKNIVSIKKLTKTSSNDMLDTILDSTDCVDVEDDFFL
ncbi:hypothetical protein [Turicibacter bilis]|uniref:DUF669 domain-containing protein n=1 Tax=Turicibacter bilis TaxID=2735723 RepID=A0ABY5JG67_9FIRM|nr:hypothetical protein [Turicibacter bilis]MBS3201476.1 hypothetical protein [Turicibacter bilis]UUF05686.1 hypothetical protein J0J69_11600 [Turicibacter bilis]